MENILIKLWDILGNNTAEVIALCALFFTAHQVYLSRRHNRLSVKPLLSAHSNREQMSGEGILDFYVSNNGVGPAIITKWKVLLNSVELKFTEHSSVESVIKHALSGRDFGFLVGTLGEGYAMPANETRKILNVHCKIKDGKDFKNVEKALNKLDLVVEYESLYGDTYKLDTRKNS